MTGSAAFLRAGADLFAGAGIASASIQTAGADDFTSFAAVSGASMRYETGSYVEMRGMNLAVGFARALRGSNGRLLFGPMVEYGRGNYDSYVNDAHGDGTVRYIGGGAFIRQEEKDGTFYEGSLRTGRTGMDYTGDLAGSSASYDTHVNYLGAHLGLGQKRTQKNGTDLEMYLRYFYTRQNGTDETVYTNGSPEKAHFDAVTSKRLRLGARYTHKDAQANEMYAGLAWEFEFGGKASAIFGEDAAPSPSLRGGSALLELGYRFAPKNSRVSYGLNLVGWQGKREGISGGLNIAWGF